MAYATNMPLACLLNAAGFRRTFGDFGAEAKVTRAGARNISLYLYAKSQTKNNAPVP